MWLKCWCLWCLFGAEVGPKRLKALKKLKAERLENRQCLCGFSASC